MIPFEYRGKDSFTKRWVFGIYLRSLPRPTILVQDLHLEVDENTVCLKTMFSDDIGQPIFTGDIIGLRLNNEETTRPLGIMEWDDKLGYFYLDDSFGLFDIGVHKPFGWLVEDINASDHTIHVMGNKWDHAYHIPGQFRKEEAGSPKPKTNAEIEVDEAGNIYVPSGASIQFPYGSSNPEMTLMCVRRELFGSCKGCALIYLDCGKLLCGATARKDQQNVIFKNIGNGKSDS